MTRFLAWLLVLATLSAIPASVNADPSRILLAMDSRQTICEEVISCGTKNGERMEYPTPCDAKNDGATDISPKTGGSCEAPPSAHRQPGPPDEGQPR